MISMVQDQAAIDSVQKAIESVTACYSTCTPTDFALLRQTLAAHFQDKKVKVSLFLQGDSRSPPFPPSYPVPSSGSLLPILYRSGGLVLGASCPGALLAALSFPSRTPLPFADGIQRDDGSFVIDTRGPPPPNFEAPGEIRYSDGTIQVVDVPTREDAAQGRTVSPLPGPPPHGTVSMPRLGSITVTHG